MNLNDISLTEFGTFWHFLTIDSDLFRSESLVNFSKFCSRKNLANISIKSLTEVVWWGSDGFHRSRTYCIYFTFNVKNFSLFPAKKNF